MLYLATLAAAGSVLCSRLLIAQIPRVRRGRGAVGAVILVMLTALCWWTMLKTPPLVVLGAALNIVWYAYEVIMLVSERTSRDNP
ncbi:MAG: hypothetical protein AAFX41_07460 [Bacteroidota bacterium]